MPVGTVKWFDTNKGYGFIMPEDNSRDVFVHISSIKKSGLTNLSEDQKVIYELNFDRNNRLNAKNIRIIPQHNHKNVERNKLIIQQKVISVGFVKWFGGINHKTGEHNDFGFFEDINNDDIYFNGNQLKGIIPKDNEFAVFIIQTDNNKKKQAIEIEICRDAENFPMDMLVEFIQNETEFKKMIASQKYKNILNTLVNRSDNRWALNFLSTIFSKSSSAKFVVGQMIKDREWQIQLFDTLDIFGNIDLDEICSFVPSHYFDERHSKWIKWLKNRSQSERRKFFKNKINNLSLSFVLICCFEEFLDQTDNLGIHNKRIANFVKKVFQAESTKNKENIGVGLHKYVLDVYKEKFNNFDDFTHCSAIASYCSVVNLFKTLEEKEQKVQFLDNLGISGIIEADETCEFVPSFYFDERHTNWIEWLQNISLTERQTFFKNKINELSTSFILVCCFEEILNQSDDLSIHYDHVTCFVRESFLTESFTKGKSNIGGIIVSDYIWDIYHEKFTDFDSFSHCSAISSFCNVVNLFRTLEDIGQQIQFLDKLGIPGIIKADDTCEFVPSLYFDERHANWIKWIKNNSQSEQQIFFKNKINNLSFSFVLVCVFEGLIQNSELLSCYTDRISRLIKYIYESEQKQNFMVSLDEITCDVLYGYKEISGIYIDNYVIDIYEKRVKSFDNLSSLLALFPFFELLKVKRKAFLKDHSFIRDINRTKNLYNDPETFVLYKLLPLIWDKNTDKTIEFVFFHQVWEAIFKEKISIDHPGFLKLFPSCGTIGSNLSCEAIFWKKEELFLCRGKKCDTPKVLPDTSKSYLNFNIYDWLDYFGRTYENHNQPSKRDFPIKMAGYFNRIKELRERLNCRSCSQLMKPDFKYSRCEVKVFDEKSQKIITEQFMAAYKITVVRCDNKKCSEYYKGCYLNHCHYWKCHEIIDSRDLDKCENGWCKCTCGSCCLEHEADNEQKRKEIAEQKKESKRKYGRRI